MIKYFLLMAMVVASVILIGCTDGEAVADPQGRWYVQGQVQKSNLVGARASIMTRLPELADTSIAKGDQFSVAYCGLSDYDGIKWAQAGYGTIRPDGFALSFPSFYCEVYGQGRQQYWSALYPNGPHGDNPPYPPNDNEEYEYQFELDISGNWEFLRDGNLVTTGFFSDSNWAGDKRASWVTWTGEITCSSSDMPGKSLAQPCVFSNLYTKKVGDNYYLVIMPSQCADCMLVNDDKNEWHIEWDTANTYVIDVTMWDKNLVF